VRLFRLVLLELGLVAGALVGLGTAVGWGSARVLTVLERRAVAAQQVLATLPLHGRQELSSPPEPPITDEPAGTFLGMSDDLLIERVRSQAIVRVKVNKGGSSLSFRVDFADGSRAAWKPVQTNLQTIPRKEVAAYRINRLLGLDRVPPAAPRQVSREELFGHLHPESKGSLPRIQAETIFNSLTGKAAGVFSYWIPEIKESGLDTPDGIKESATWLTVGNPVPRDKAIMAAQLSDLVVFDFLTANPDRYSGGNMKMSPDGSRLYYMDNTLAFFLNPDGHEKNRIALERTQRFSRRLVRALDRVTAEGLAHALAEDGTDPHDLLTPSELRAVVSRREAVQRYVASLTSTLGEANVLAFP
jgi:hypothetical protein